MRDGRGAPTGRLVVFRNVSERAAAEQALRVRERFLDLLNDITRAALVESELQAVLQTVADRLGELLDADGCYITLWDEASQRVIPAAAFGVARQTYAAQSPLPGEVTMTESVLRAGAPLVVEDVYDTPYLSKRIAELFPDRSLLGLPLIAGSRRLGAALVAYNEPHRFSPEEISRGKQAAEQISLAIDKTRLLEAERRQRQLAETLRQAGAAVAETLSPDDTLARILHQLEKVVPYDSACIFLQQQNGLRAVAAQGFPPDEQVVGQLYPVADDLLFGEMKRTRRPLCIGDAQADPRFQRWGGSGYARGWIGVPMVVRGDVIGCLTLDSRQIGAYDAVQVGLVQAFANQAAVAIENAQLYSRAQQRVVTLELLRRTSLQLTASFDLSTVLEGIAESALTLVGATDCHIYLYDEVSDALSFGVARWNDGRSEAAVAAPRSHGLTATVARTGEPLIINDAASHPLYSTPDARPWDVQAVAGFPLKRGERVVGVFTIAFVTPHIFSSEELQVLGLLADQAAIALENARLVQGLESEVKARTAEIQDEKEKSDAILHSVGDAIAVVDLEMRIHYVNPAFTDLTGYEAEHAIGRDVHV